MVRSNMTNGYDAFRLRLTSHAQAEIRSVYQEIYKIAQHEYPQVFTDELYTKLSEGH